MKKVFIIIISTLLPLLAYADPVEINGLYYNLIPKGKEAEVVRNPNGEGLYSGDIIIPEKVTYDGCEYIVTKLCSAAFYRCFKLSSLTIPNTITSIGEFAAGSLDGFPTISIYISDLDAWCDINYTLSDEVYPAFNSYNLYLNGVKLEDLVIPQINSIKSHSFRNCKSIKSVKIPSCVTSIGVCAFEGCDGLNSVHISDIEAWCKIAFGSNPLSYAQHLYVNDEEVKNLVIPNSVTSIVNGLFANCIGLTSVTIPNSVKCIGDGAFQNCSALASVTIPNSVTSIGRSAFYGCSGLSSVTIPNSLTFLDENTFQGCSGLISVIISNSVTSIGSYAFSGCSGLTTIIIPNSVTSIDKCAFYDCSSLTSISIPNGVTSIGEYAFSGCSSLTSITLGSSLTSIGDYAFYNCSGLTSLTIPKSVTSIRSGAFGSCTSLTCVTIGSGMKLIEYQAFANCDMLTDVYCLAEKLSKDNSWEHEGLYTSTDAFDNSYPQYMILHIPATSIEAYRSTEPWDKFKMFEALVDGDNPETPEILKCVTPEITYTDGKLIFTCKTEGVQFMSEITVDDAKKYFDASVTLSQTYKVTVYASKEGYENSDVVTREIVIENGQASLFGDLNKDGKVNVADHVKLSDIIMNK